MFQFFFSVVIFLLGLIIGSFLNCLIYRLETEESFWKGRSFCPRCRHKLSWQDLIPVLSFFLLRRKCRYCKELISWQYPLIEIATGLLFLLIFNFQFSIFNFIIASLLIVIFVYDLKYYIIPDKIVYPAILVSGIWYTVYGLALYTVYSALGAAAFFLSIVLLSRGKWMGFGDVKLAFLMGLFLGWPNVFIALFLAFFIGAVLGVILIISGKKQLSSEIPFGPFLV
ncbi:MAG: prepilin peptidase, partial [bacterium]|nr:prepilin peptidase [bacterium]